MSKSLLVVSTDSCLSRVQRDRMADEFGRYAAHLGFELVIADGGMSVSVDRDLSPLIEAINKQTESVCALAESNRALIAMMADDVVEVSGDCGRVTYLDDHLG
jgi:hypothetical protein